LHRAPDEKLAETVALIHDLVAQHQVFRCKIDERRGLMVCSDELDESDLGEAFLSWDSPAGMRSYSHPSQGSAG
jgi:hypothetical protein